MEGEEEEEKWTKDRMKMGYRREWRGMDEGQEEEGLKDRWIKRRDGWIRTRGWERQIRDKGRYEITCNDNQ